MGINTMPGKHSVCYAGPQQLLPNCKLFFFYYCVREYVPFILHSRLPARNYY